MEDIPIMEATAKVKLIQLSICLMKYPTTLQTLIKSLDQVFTIQMHTETQLVPVMESVNPQITNLNQDLRNKLIKEGKVLSDFN